MAADNLRESGVFSRTSAWFKREIARLRHRDDTVVILPQRAVCFHGALTFSLPADFKLSDKKKDLLMLESAKTGLQLTLMRLPFNRPLRRLTAADLQLSFRKLIPPEIVPELRYGFARYSPTVTASWQHPPVKRKLRRGNIDVTLEQGAEKTVLHLVQVRKTAFLMLFRHVAPEYEAHVNAVLYSVSVDPAKAAQ
ncbi:MAG: hypothetical protein K5705_11675 [Oscillospiraceae bacterium]|nr:hypothetical protein [Oscillospiraceae bacterium]